MKGSRGKFLFFRSPRSIPDTFPSSTGPARTAGTSAPGGRPDPRGIGELALELLFPSACRLCDRCLPSGADFCDRCLRQLQPHACENRRLCFRCGRPAAAQPARTGTGPSGRVDHVPLAHDTVPSAPGPVLTRPDSDARSACGKRDCENFHFDACFPLWTYTGPARDAVIASKYGSQIALCDALGRRLGLQFARGCRPCVVEAARTSGDGTAISETGDEVRAGTAGAEIPGDRPDLVSGDRPDLVTSVPSHWVRRIQRAGGGSRPLAKAFAAALARSWTNVRHRDLLQTTRRIRKQAWQSERERAENVRGAFRLTPLCRSRLMRHVLEQKHILLVDDVMTTGATANEIAGILKSGGARRVTVAVVARAWAD